MADSSRSASNNGTRTTTPKVAADGGSIVPAGATGRRPSMHPANPRETDIATTKRAVPVGDPLPQTSHLPAIGEPTAAPSRGAVGSAVARSRENIDDQGQESDKTLEKPGLSDDFFYDKATFKASGVSAKQIPFDSLHLFYCFGFESTRRNNLHYVNEHIIATIVGNVLVFLNLRTMDQDYLAGLRDGAIGSIAVHPSRKYIAVAEVFDDEPNIYMFEYPSLQLYRVLRQGAEKGFSNVCFNTEGDKLASVGMDPDYMLTIWDWKQEKIVLRSKAFSQDVYNVAFSPETDGQLTTAGMGHIKFWRMASTFTGLKLQGYIGKFGLTELTDISTFVQLPDGKVLSSTDTGNLLLWDGGMIKCEIAGKGRKPCHQGKVEVVTLLDGEIITAGEDGYIRVWDFETIDTADVVTTGSAGSQGGAPDAGAPTNSVAQARVFEMEPIDEILVGKDVKIKSMARTPGTTTEYLVQDQVGHLFRVDTQKRLTEKLLSFHFGAVAGVDTSPLAHVMASLGADGALRLYDYVSKSTVATMKYPQGGTSLVYLPETLDGRGCAMAAGFADGVLRLITHTPLALGGNNINLDLQAVFKPHSGPITSIAVSADGGWLATTSTDKTVFFFKINAEAPPTVNEVQPPIILSTEFVQIIPLGFLSLDVSPVKISFSPDNHLNIDEIEPVDENDDFDEKDKKRDDKADEEIDGKRALLVLDDGQLMSLTIPQPESIDNSLSFQLSAEQLQLRRWSLEVPVPKVPTVIPTQKEKDGDTQEAQDPTSPPAAASESAEEEKDNEPAKINGRLTSAARKAHGLVIEDQSPIINTMYLEGGYFLIALQNKDGEYEVRACKFGTPRQSRLVLVYKSPFTDLRLSTSGKYLLAGAADGMTCLRKFRLEDILLYRWEGGHEKYDQYSEAFDKEEAHAAIRRENDAAIIEEGDSTENLALVGDTPGQYWFGHAHANTSGRVTGVASTFDDSFFTTAGTDGGLFVWRVTMEDIKSSEAFEGPEALEFEDGGADDIVDPSAYSLQQAKIEMERDKEFEDAENKKQVTRDDIQELRNEFVKLVNENERLVGGDQIPRPAMTIDPDLRSDIEKETEEKILSVRRELEWSSQKESVVPDKLQRTFLDVLQTGRIQIKAFQTPQTVATFRTTKLDPSIDQALQPLIQADARSSRTIGNNRDSSVEQTGRGEQPEVASSEAPVSVKHHGKVVEMKNKLEARKQLRAERAAMWKELAEAKPDENYEDPRDVAAIRYAEQHMGDYKLKTGEKYIVPESDRVDADKKRRQILLLKESAFTLKEQFNEKILALRDHKRALTDQVQEHSVVLEQINSELQNLGLSVETTLWRPVMESSAYPENRYIVTAADMAQLKKDDAQAFQNARGNGDDGIGGFGSSTQAKETPAVPTPNKSRPTTVGGGGGNGPTGAMRASVNFMNSGTPLAGDGRKSDAAGNHGASPGANMDRTEELMQNKSVLELREQEIRQTELLFRKDRITMAIKKSVQSFDLSVDHLVKERVVLEADLKSADMKLLLLYREWVLLKEFEKHDNQLADKLSQKRNEKDEIDGKIKECQEKLNAKKAEIESVIKREKEVQEEVRRTIGENNRHEDYLTKVFKKKIKRSKKKPKAEGLDARGNGNDGEHEDEDEFDEDEEEDDMDDFDDEESGTSENNDGVEECPADWDASSFARVLALREERLDQDDILNEIQKTVEVLKKENDALLKKEKTIDMALRTTETEIQEFQTQKQQKLNELSVTIPLRLHQMQYLDKGALPSDLSPALVFVNEGLLKLRNRIKELQQERADIRKQHKELRKMHVGLIKSRKEKLQKLQELEARATDVQMLKFGQIIDLEKVERMGVNKSADELREKLAKEDAKRLKEVEIIEAEIERLREAFIEVTRENTLRLESLVDLTDTRQKLEEQLNASQLSVTAEYSGPQTKDLEEREKLVNLVHLRAQEIEDLKREIEMLIRKPMRQLPPVLRKRFETAQSMGGGLPTLPGGGMVTADGIVLDSFDMGALPPASEVILQE